MRKAYGVPLGRLKEELEKLEHPERSAYKAGIGWDYIIQTWPSREAMARSIRMQEKRAPRSSDWRAVEKLSPGEGH